MISERPGRRMDFVPTFVYAAAKFAAYCAWCYLLLPPAPDRRPARAIRYGAIRWLIGLFAGITVFFAAGSIDAGDAASKYLAIYVPLRIVEWGLMAWLITGPPRGRSIGQTLAWIAGGIAVSFATDMLSPDGMAGRFCTGRCLC
jgi:hypothetical protein